jgi:hypothetical protein
MALAPFRFLGSSSLLAIAALFSLATMAQAEFTTLSGWDRQVFPSYAVATATLRAGDVEEAEGEEADETELGDPRGILGVQLESPADDATVTVTITCSDIMEPSTFTGTLAQAGETYTIRPRIKYKYGALTQNKQATPITVTFSVEIAGEDAEEQSETITLRSINDCPFALVDEDDQVTDLSYMFAAYVNEQHPFADKVLREALDREAVDSFTGYQAKDPAEVYRQVYALWDVLSERDVRYSDITTTAGESAVVYSQHVRLLDESVNNGQANCADGSVLFASLLRKIGIESYLVMVPGHCYLAFALDAEGKDLVALETTLLQSEAPEEFSQIEGLSDLLDEQWLEEDSYAVFSAAIAVGTANLVENSQKFADENEPDYLLVSVSQARKMGILPIGFKSTAQFAPVELRD